MWVHALISRASVGKDDLFSCWVVLGSPGVGMGFRSTEVGTCCKQLPSIFIQQLFKSDWKFCEVLRKKKSFSEHAFACITSIILFFFLINLILGSSVLQGHWKRRWKRRAAREVTQKGPYYFLINISWLHSDTTVNTRVCKSEEWWGFYWIEMKCQRLCNAECIYWAINTLPSSMPYWDPKVGLNRMGREMQKLLFSITFIQNSNQIQMIFFKSWELHWGSKMYSFGLIPLAGSSTSEASFNHSILTNTCLQFPASSWILLNGVGVENLLLTPVLFHYFDIASILYSVSS